MRYFRFLVLKINGLLGSELFSTVLSVFLSGSFICVSTLPGFFFSYALKFFFLYYFRIATSAKNLLCIGPRVSCCIFLTCYWAMGLSVGSFLVLMWHWCWKVGKRCLVKSYPLVVSYRLLSSAILQFYTLIEINL